MTDTPAPTPSKDTQQEQRRKRRAHVMELRIQGLSLAEITLICIAEDLCPTPVFKTAFELIRYDLKRMAAAFDVDSDELIPVYRKIYVKRQEQIYREAYEKSRDPDCPNAAAMLRVAMDANERWAAAQGVITQPKIPVEIGASAKLREVMQGFVDASKRGMEGEAPAQPLRLPTTAAQNEFYEDDGDDLDGLE